MLSTSLTQCFTFRSLLLISILLMLATSAHAQTTAFTYQGRLTDASAAANGQYDFEFKLFDTPSPGTGTQAGATLTRENVVVTNGVFTVGLDFGASVFPGADRFLEIGARQGASTDAFIPLSPRQPVTSTPYAIQTLKATSAASATNATQLGGVAASEFVRTATGGANFIQNTTTPQTADFNITGSGTANIFNAATQYNLDGQRVLSVAGNLNFFAGINAGTANTTGEGNSFFGARAGQANTTGCCNSFFGRETGTNNTTGKFNSFFGQVAGEVN